MRQIILDTETTGLEPADGHRIIEIGCLEMCARQLTGKTFHYYLNPGRKVDNGALAIHGISTEFLADKPSFAEIIDPFLDFVADSEIVAHNAPFDIGFLINEIKLLARDPKIFTNKVAVIDTLMLARKMFPGQRNSLDALCKRFKIDISARNLHGALLDANLLARVYLCLTGGQTSLFSEGETEKTKFSPKEIVTKPAMNHQNLTVIHANQTELAAHEKFMEKIRKILQKKEGEKKGVQ